jgi:hypothetical protein
MIKQNGFIYISLFLILFLSSCSKKGNSNLSRKLQSLNDNTTKEFTATDKNNYTTQGNLGTYSLNNEDMSKIGIKVKKKIILESADKNNVKDNGNIPLNDQDLRELNKIARYDPNIQKHYGLSNKQMIQIEKENRRNSYEKTLPYNKKFKVIDLPYHHSLLRSENY